jgi:hypothetical protein
MRLAQSGRPALELACQIVRTRSRLATLRVINSPRRKLKRFWRIRMFVEKSRIAVAAVGRLIMAALAIFLSSAIGQAAVVVIDEAEMNAIFSQPSFGDTPISIRFNPPRQIVAPELLVIDNLTELQALYNLASDPAPTVVAFFVDQLNACGTVEENVNGAYNGCAQFPGRFLVEDFNAAELDPGELMGHELGHNLDLGHIPLGLMAPMLGFGGPPELFDFQVATILQSPLVQTDATGQRFIQITPIAIVGTPEPSTMLLLCGALGALLIIKTKKSTGTRLYKVPLDIKS